jgi:hypothetical protein
VAVWTCWCTINNNFWCAFFDYSFFLDRHTIYPPFLFFKAVVYLKLVFNTNNYLLVKTDVYIILGLSYFMKKGQVSVFMILGLIILLSSALSLYVYSSFADDFVVSDVCTDCAVCGCLESEVCRPSGECVAISDSNFTVFFVPINYAPDDIDFRARIELYKTQLSVFTSLKQSNFVVVDKTLQHEDCGTVGAELDSFVDSWHQKRTGLSLPGLKIKGAIPVYTYRIIGIDRQKQSDACGCGYTLLYSPLVYVGGAECSRAEHAVLHELSHTFGLCDEYDTCVWDESSAYLTGAFGHGCLNSKPNADNSDCSNECCSESGVCCLGKYADKKADGFFGVLGSADVPPSRRISAETNALIDNFLCDNLEVCV